MATTTDATVDRDTQIELFRAMQRIHRADARVRKGLSGGEFAFSYWPVDGQEAIGAGVSLALEDRDQVVTTYRGLGDVVGRGVELTGYFGELLGRSIGLSKGKAGAMGISAPEQGIAYSTGIVGAGPLLANGIALAAQMLGTGQVVVVNFGDGATSIGFVHEAMNLAALWSLPVVFVCQNNAWAECTPLEGYTRSERLADRAAGYGMPGVTVDGTDPVAVHGEVAAAVARARAGEGPTFVEATAYRLQGHYFGDGQGYVDADELAAARAADPAGTYRARLIESGVLTEDEASAIEAEIDAEIDQAVQAALAAEEPPASELYVDVYADRDDDGSKAVPTAAVEIPGGETVELGLVAALNRTLDRAMARDERIVLLGEDIADSAGGGMVKVTAGLSTKYGDDRVRNTPIAESSIIGAATGAAMAGLRPVPELMFMDFLGVALDQIANHAAKVRYLSGGRLSAPMTIRATVGAGAGPQHSQALEAIAMHVPGMKVVWPSTSADAVGLLNACLDDDDPCLFVESMKLYFAGGRTPVPVADFTLPLGKVDVKREGGDVTVVSYGTVVHDALAAAETLAGEGVEVEVVDLRTLVPLDLEGVLTSVRKTRRLVVAHESVEFCGPGAEIAASVGTELFGELDAPIRRVAGTYTPVPRAASLEALCHPGPDAIVAAVRSM